MSDDASNSSDPQARRRRRRRRRSPGRADDGPERGERAPGAPGSEQRAEGGPDGSPAGQGERRASEGARRRVRSARPDGRSDSRSEGRSESRGEARSDGGREARSEARSEERSRRRRRRRPRGEGGSEASEADRHDTAASGAHDASGEAASPGGREGGRLRGSRGGSRGRRQRDERKSERWREPRSGAEPGAPAWDAEGAQQAFGSRAAADDTTDDTTDTTIDATDGALDDDRFFFGRGSGAAALPDSAGGRADLGAEGFEAGEDEDAVAPSRPSEGPADEPEDALPREVTLHPDLPDDAPADDPDPLTWPMTLESHVSEDRTLDTPVRNVVGVKFSPAGRIYLYDAGDHDYQRGEEVVVESDRGVRIGTVAVNAVRKPRRQQDLKRVLRRPNRSDLRADERNQERASSALKMARDVARTVDLPIKIFRVEYAHSGKKAQVYFTAEDRVDFRDLVRELSLALRCRVEMRQTGVRDEAKLVGGIGSCGQELCCTTWLPEFVPVSIKMAKDQGLVLNPTKVSGQCGRLKCCLVYEQPIYAELRKGLPKLGKRVVTEAGEGRVVEVDVLHQRVRVSLGPGEFQVFPADQVKPMFPSQQQQQNPPDRK